MEQSLLDDELRLVACVHNEDDVPGVLRLLVSSHGTKKCPLHLVVLHSVELRGRGLPILVSHRNELHKKPKGPARQIHQIFRGFQNLEEQSGGHISVHPFTSISPHKTVKEDIYKLALENKAFLIIMPFHKQTSYSKVSMDKGVGRVVARGVLADATWSVGILVDNGDRLMGTTFCTAKSPYHIGLVFVGGPDDRETLAYAMKMAERPGVHLTVLRCEISTATGDGEKEEDEMLLAHFKLKVLPAAEEGSVLYKEQTVQDVRELVDSIRGMGSNFDLMMVGRRHCCYPDVEMALSGWSECAELGVIGDFLASSDFAQSSISLLVVQQRERKGKEIQYEYIG